MSSIFAIQVMSGKEFIAQSEMCKRMKMCGMNAIKNVIAFEIFTKRFCGAETVRTKARCVVPGYIFVEVEDAITDLKAQAAELWHFIKSIPFVQRILQYNIQDDEFENFFEIVTEESDEVVVSVMEESAGVSQQNLSLQMANASKNPATKKFWLNVLANCNSLLERLEVLKRQAAPFLSQRADIVNSHDPTHLTNEQKNLLHIIKHSMGWVRGRLTTFRFSEKLFTLTRNSIDPDHRMSNSLLTTGSFIVPHLLSYLEKEFFNLFPNQ
ncbi:transcription antitermination factor NusG [Brevibacillus aydinogluensis]|uniref:transcription termination/antitermination NusG family protein n=1 Tax=Brevibacillus aydinogluensis TaxID=927786 RepID=UPI002892F886|nr:transcription termination/antitermination NusG family protein [Brevibacillus aydinogluensis]MDT3417197.1 transcription antitermination factor NusG [Brevibacillus aydinogluensis]